MLSIDDRLDETESLKLATIYRKKDLNYVYVCYRCKCSFTNIVDTLNHVESHLDEKTNVAVENYEFVDIASEIVSDTVDVKLDSDLSVENVNRTENEYEFQPKFKCHEDIEEFTSLTSKCKICNKNFKATAPLIVHMIREHATKSSLTCPHCCQNWENEKTFPTHIREHVNDNETTYDALIDKVTSSCAIVTSSTVKQPRAKLQRKSNLVCDICLSSFSNRTNLIVHMKDVHIKRPTFDCDKCNRTISGKFAFYAHRYGHLTDGDVVNAIDPIVLQQNLRQFLDDNIYCDESNAEKKFGCKVCSHLSLTIRKSAELHILQKHIYYVRGNTANRKFPCPYCHMNFAHSSTLTVHKQFHELGNKFSCSICKKTFAQLRYLRTHEITHSDIKSHQCTSCGDTFRTMVRLNYHMRSHLNVTSKCTICSKEVKTHRLKNHMRDVHENSHRPYTCSFCSQSFKTARTLKTHSYRHTGEKKFECRFHCNEMFISSAARRSHERSKHEPH